MRLTDNEVTIQSSEKHMKWLDRSFKKFISDLQLPIYGKMEHFNYYDCFAAFVKYVFEMSHRKEWEDREENI